ncbi:MAG: autotransporter domain-containing protein [Pseudomonadota bacterium]
MENKKNPGFLNRHDRRRHKALERQRAKQTHRRQTRLHTALLASATVGVLATANLSEATAQVVLNPPGTIPAQCTISGNAAICEGDLSPGIDADGPPLDSLTIRNLTANIAPAANVDAIDFDATNGNITINVDGSDGFGIVTTTVGAGIDGDGIEADVTGNGNIDITNSAGISTAGRGADGIDAFISGTGTISITNTGDIRAVGGSSDGIDTYIPGSGNTVINNDGSIDVVGFGITAFTTGDGNITVTSTRQVTASSFSGVFLYSGGAGSITLNQTGDINGGEYGVYARNTGSGGNVAVTVTGNVTAEDEEGIYASSVNGNATLDVTGNVTAARVGVNVFANSAGVGIGNAHVVIKGNVTSATRAGINVDGANSVTIDSTGDVNAVGLGIYGSVVTGPVSITSTGDVRATGTGSYGIQGNVTSSGNTTITSVGDVTADAVAISGRSINGNVTVRSSGNLIGTTGIEANTPLGNITVISDGTMIGTGTGIFAPAANGNITVVNSADLTNFASAIFASSALGSSTVENSGNVISTATGIFATAIGLPGAPALVSVTNTGDITAQFAPIFASGSNANVVVNNSGNLTAPGANGVGISVNASTAGFAGTVNVTDSAIQGGSGTGTAVQFNSAADATNTLNTSGTVTLSSLAGIAVNGGVGDTTINNFGTLNTVTNGAINLGGGTNAFNNRGGGIFNSGGIVNLGAGNIFSNSGTFSPGAADLIQNTAITGTVVQDGGGILLSSLDPSAGIGDLVTVSETATLAGNVQAHVINPAFGDQSVTILSAAGGTTNNGLGLLASPALQASLSFPNANDVVLNTSIDFSAGGLNPNQTALAGSLNSALANGLGGLEPVLDPLLNNIFTVGDYQNALNQLLPEVMLNNETATLFSSEDFVDNLFSCRLAGQNHTALSEGECYWARPQGRFLDRDSDSNTIGFDETSGGLAAGAQVAVAPNWFAGFALGYERASLDTDTGAETDSNRFSGGLSLKYQAGSFLLGAAISGGVSGNDTQRPISFGGVTGFNATAESNYAIKTLTGRARAAYVFQFRDWFAKPLVDVTATYLSRDGVTETGAGAANLALSSSDDTFFSVTPALEIGGDIALSETSVIRPYVRAGVSYYTDSDHGLTASFVNAPAGTSAFSIKSNFDDVFADVAAGATAFFDNGSTLGLAYEGLLSSDTQQHGISLKGTLRF